MGRLSHTLLPLRGHCQRAKEGDNAESGEIANPGAPLGSVCRREVVKQAKPLAVGVVAAVVARADVNKFTERLSGFWTKPRFW